MDQVYFGNTKLDETLFFCSLDYHSLGVKAFLAVCNDGDGLVQPMQPSCCRELIFTEPDILLSPCLESPNKMYIVCKKDILNAEEFQERLKKHVIEIQIELEVTPELFQYCLQFTMIQRLAPLWNRVGNYLVQGRGFLGVKSKMNAVRLQITVMDKICFSIAAFQLKLPPCQIQDFSVSQVLLDQFQSNRLLLITDINMDNNQCLVIPSLNRANICSVSRQIPATSPFETYDELRKHWKLMYGYHLPSRPCEEYYNVAFFKDKYFTYPSYCIRSQDPIYFPRCDHESILNSFLQDVILRMPNFCGMKIVFDRTPYYQQMRLCEAVKRNAEFLTTKPISKQRTFPISHTLTNALKKSTATLLSTASQHAAVSVHPSEKKDGAKSALQGMPDKGGLQKFIPSFAKRQRSIDSKQIQKRRREVTTDDELLHSVKNKKHIAMKYKNPPNCPADDALLVDSIDDGTILHIEKDQNRKSLMNSTELSCDNDSSHEFRKNINVTSKPTSTKKQIEKNKAFDIPNMNGLAQVGNSMPQTTISRTSAAINLAKEIIAAMGDSASPTESFPRVCQRSLMNSHDYSATNQEVDTYCQQDKETSRIKKGKKLQEKKAQKSIEISDPVQKDQLKKLGTANLKAWLKSKGISVKANTKKADLLSKAEEYMRAHQVEE